MKSLFWTEMRWFLIVAAPAIVAVFAIAYAPVAWLVVNVVPDDGFYYFKIARNIVDGAGSTFDGVELTNGYHPLWMVVILPLFALFGDDAAMRLSLLLCGMLFIASGALLWSIAYRWGLSRTARMIGLGFWLYNPFLLFEMMNGLETALATFLLLSTFLMIETRGASVRGSLLVGLLMGTAVLARLDFAIYAVGFFVWYAVRPAIAQPERLRQVAAYSCAVAALFLPWFAFNYTAYNMLATSASSINPMVTRELILSDNGFSKFALVKGTVSAVYDQAEFVVRSTGAAEIVLIALGVVVLARIFSLQGAVARREPGLFLLGSFVLYFFVNTAGRLTGRTWYFVLISVFAAYVVAEMIDVVRARIAAGTVRTAMVSSIVVLIVGSFFLRLNSDVLGRHAAQIHMLETSQWLQTNLEAGSKVAVFNSGIVGFFAPDIRVINIDGLVNNSARDAMEERQLWAYVTREADYFADLELYLTYRYRRFLGVEDPFENLKFIATIGESDNRGILNVYEIKQ